MNLAPKYSPYEPKKPRRIPFETFYKKYEKGWKGYKYEWNDGIIEKTTAMKLKEIHVVNNLQKRFFELDLNTKGMLSSETEVWTSKIQWRKPDIAYFSNEQIKIGAEGENTIPLFVIEVLSTFDPINIVTNKLIEYFKAGVQTVWHIFPEQKLIYVFTSVKNITVCEGEDICSATPALPEFNIMAQDIFKK